MSEVGVRKGKMTSKSDGETRACGTGDARKRRSPNGV